MKNKTKSLLSSLTLLLAAFAFAACSQKSDDHAHGDHDHSDPEQEQTEAVKIPGPNGGRLIATVQPQVEFFLRDDNKAQLTFVDDSAKPIALSGQTATLVTGDRMNPTTLTFEPVENTLVTTDPLPEIEGQPVILTIQVSPESTPVVEHLNLKTYTCSGCGLSEYACICGH